MSKRHVGCLHATFLFAVAGLPKNITPRFGVLTSIMRLIFGFVTRTQAPDTSHNSKLTSGSNNLPFTKLNNHEFPGILPLSQTKPHA